MKCLFIILFVTYPFSLLYAQTIDHPELEKELYLEKEYHPIFEDFKKIELPTEVISPESSSFDIITDKKDIKFSSYIPKFQFEFDKKKLSEKKNPEDKSDNKKKGYLNLDTNIFFKSSNIDFGIQFLNDQKNQLYINETNSNNTIFFLRKKFKKIKIENYLSIFSIYHNYQFNDISNLKTSIQYFFNHYYDTLQKIDSFNKYQTYSYYLFQIHTSFFKKNINSLNYKIDFTYSQSQQKNNFLDTNFSFETSHYSIIVNPYYIYSYNRYKMYIGTIINIEYPYSIFITPNIRISWTPIEKALIHLNVNNEVKNNCVYNTFFIENLYLTPKCLLDNSKILLDVNLNLDLQIIHNIQLNFFSKYQTIQNVYNNSINYYQDTLSTNINSFKIGGIILYNYLDIFDINIESVFSKKGYDKTNYEKNVWNFPYLINNIPYLISDIEVYYKFSTVPLKFYLNYQYNLVLKKTRYFNEKEKTTSSNNNNYIIVFKTIYTYENNLSLFISIGCNELTKKYIYDKNFTIQTQSFINLSGGINFKF